MLLATPNSWKVALMLAWFSCWNLPSPAQDSPGGAGEGPRAFAVAAQKAFDQAQEHYRQNPDQVEAAWQFGRACFDLAEFATRNAKRADLAQQGIAACRQALVRASNSAPARYYLGLNLGQLARTKTLGALRLVSQMEPEFTTARALDEHLDYAGPDRCLGLLYRDAPSIGSIGSRSKAREHLERAVALAPDYPENRLNLLEAELQWGDRDGASRELAALEASLPAARASLNGPAWASSWADWEPRLRAAKNKLEAPKKKLEAPREKG